MKKIILSIFAFLGFAGFAQTITEANHAPMNGDHTFGVYQCDSTGVTPGASGSGASWNFSSVSAHLSTIKTYSTLTSTNAAYNPADVYVSSGATNTNYYRSATTKLNFYGGDLSVNGINLNVKYATPAVVALYPMSLNSTTTSITNGTVVTSLTSGAFSGTCSVTADASGTLILPTKTFTNALRVVTSQTLSAPSLFNTVVNLLVYDYYVPGICKAPLLSINSSTITSSIGGTSTQTVVTMLQNYDVVSVKDSKMSDIELSVFPNPASNVINFSTANIEAMKVVAFDVTGKVVATELIEMGKAKINLATLSSGVYVYHVLDKNNQTLTTGKFNVSK